jgi:circadian clock protein KaiC
MSEARGHQIFCCRVFSHLKIAIYIREFVILIITKYILKVVITMSQKNNLSKKSVPSVVIGEGQHTQKLSSVMLQKTGIPGLDEILNGGLPRHTISLLAGTTGSGKTIFSFQWLFDGVKQGENGIYISITEPLSIALRNIESMEFYDRTAIEQEKLRLFDIKEAFEYDKIDSQSLLRYIEKQVKENNAKRLVIDSITGILYAINDKAKITEFMFELKKILATLGCTTILISKVTEKNTYSVYGVEELIPDGVITLNTIIGENQIIRTLQVIKMRGVNFRTGASILDITSSGIKIYPKIPINREVSTTEFKNRLPSGIKKLDSLCGGGFPQGHVIMVAGNTGSGKTTFVLQFLLEGLKNGEGAVCVALEESASQIKKTALAHGWDLDKYEKSGKLIFINPDLIDLNPDKLLYQIVDAVNKTNAQRMVMDSASSLESITMNKNKVRVFLIQLSGFLKTKGTTSILSYLSEDIFGASLGQLLGSGASSELRLSSITDGIILLRYTERARCVEKLMNILKMRGSIHNKKIWRFEIGKDGMRIGQVFKRQVVGK